MTTKKNINGYALSKNYFDWAFNNPSKNNPTMTALYFFLVEVNNRLGWKKEFGVSSRECMEAMGVASYNTYKKSFDLLVAHGFVQVIKSSANQYQANIIALSDNEQADDNALATALSNNANANDMASAEGAGALLDNDKASATASSTAIDASSNNANASNRASASALSNNNKTAEKHGTKHVRHSKTTNYKQYLVESDDSTTLLSFENIWQQYQKKGNRKTSRQRWDKLSTATKRLALANIPQYVLSTPNKQYRKSLEAYIQQEVWNDELASANSLEANEAPMLAI